MAKKIWWIWTGAAALGFFLAILHMVGAGKVHAATSTPSPTPNGPDRYTTVTVDITLREWWLIAWADNDVYCSFFSEHEGLPTNEEIYSACSDDVYVEWISYSSACTAPEVSSCPGYYLQNVSQQPSTRQIAVKLPPPQVWVSLQNCNPDPDGWCSTPPTLLLRGEDPLPNESITSIQGFAGSDPFFCEGETCEFNLQATDSEGISLQFWANSTYGDTSPAFTAEVRVLQQGGESEGERLVPRWYVDVLSSQWQGENLASCSITWDAFPPTEGLPAWLQTPEDHQNLQSNIPYTYLAGNLITQGVVDASACPDGGLTETGAASACGMSAARPQVDAWQDQFDTLIVDIAQKTQVPAQLLKNLFSRESQFWPGVFRDGEDVGLGQLTEDGADTLLLWNPAFYAEFCPLVLSEESCAAKGYANQPEENRVILRAALVNSVDATCETCPLGLDISRANFSVAVFGRTLLANCEQTGKIVQNITGKAPGKTLSYEDLWKLTLVNYNAGSGCLSSAAQAAYQPGSDPALNWDMVANALSPACAGAKDYVEDISQAPSSQPTPVPYP